MTTAVKPTPDTPDTLDLPPNVTAQVERDLTGGSASAVFDTSKTYRYLLTRIWDPAAPVACWVMLNPSTADAANTDNTLRRVVTFSAGFSCGGAVLVNLFALRSRHPHKLTTHQDPVGPMNDSFLQWAIRSTNGGPVIAAWGAWGSRRQLRARTAHVRGLLRAAKGPVGCLGQTTTSSGEQPLHPLMLDGHTQLRPYPLENTPDAHTT